MYTHLLTFSCEMSVSGEISQNSPVAEVDAGYDRLVGE